MENSFLFYFWHRPIFALYRKYPLPLDSCDRPCRIYPKTLGPYDDIRVNRRHLYTHLSDPSTRSMGLEFILCYLGTRHFWNPMEIISIQISQLVFYHLLYVYGMVIYHCNLAIDPPSTDRCINLVVYWWRILFRWCVFYALDRQESPRKGFGFHEIWHVMVLAGSFSHFWVMYKYITIIN